MWLTGRLVPDHKTIADFRKDNGPAIRKVCARFVELCRAMGLLTKASVAIDGSKFKAVNNRDRNFTRAKMERRMAQIEESVARYLQQLDTADRQEPSEALKTKTPPTLSVLTRPSMSKLCLPFGPSYVALDLTAGGANVYIPSSSQDEADAVKRLRRFPELKERQAPVKRAA